MVNRYIGVFAPEVKTPECADATIDWSRHCCDHVGEHGLGPDNTGFEAFGVLLAAIVLMTLRQE